MSDLYKLQPPAAVQDVTLSQDDRCRLIQFKHIFQYKLCQPAETRAAIYYIPVTEIYSYLAEEEHGKEREGDI